MTSKKNKAIAFYELKITLSGVVPTVWRRVLVPRDISLANLHLVIQIAMGWNDDHLHEFQIGRKRYAAPNPNAFGLSEPPVDESIVRLNGVAKPRARFQYQYDFGDDWLHEIVIESESISELAVRAATCSAGENACPPEDCGGPHGYKNMREILGNPQHEEYSYMKEWLGDEFDPEHFALNTVAARLASLKL